MCSMNSSDQCVSFDSPVFALLGSLGALIIKRHWSSNPQRNSKQIANKFAEASRLNLHKVQSPGLKSNAVLQKLPSFFKK